MKCVICPFQIQIIEVNDSYLESSESKIIFFLPNLHLIIKRVYFCKKSWKGSGLRIQRYIEGRGEMKLETQ